MFWLFLIVPILTIVFYVFHRNRKNTRAREVSSNPAHYDHAIVIGGSIGGVVTAAYLTKYFTRVTILESDDVLNETLLKCSPEQLLAYRCELESPTSLGRSGVPQIYQVHAIHVEGHKVLRELFPHLDEQLLRDFGISMYSLRDDLWMNITDLSLNKDLTEDFHWLGADRFTLETVLRRLMYAQFPDQITWKANCRVTQLIADTAANLVQGVRYRNKKNTAASSEDLHGDFIVDCTGRYSSSGKWLKDSLNVNIPTTQIHFGAGCVTFIGERFKTGNDLLDASPLIGCTANAPVRNTGFYATAIRQMAPTGPNSLGTLSTLTVYCVNSEYPPNDSYENLIAWAEDKLTSECVAILKSTRVCGPLVPFRRVIDERKHVEALGKRWPQNYVLLGDAMCTFNPQFGQGMTHACRQARALANIFAEGRYPLDEVAHLFNKQASMISEECWRLSTANDWKTPTLKVVTIDRHGHSETRQRDDYRTANGKSPL